MLSNIVGLATAPILYLTILFGKGRFKTKLFWTVIIILSVIVQQLTEPIIIDSLYRIYISQNKSTLAEINNILLQKSGDIIISHDNTRLAFRPLISMPACSPFSDLALRKPEKSHTIVWSSISNTAPAGICLGSLTIAHFSVPGWGPFLHSCTGAFYTPGHLLHTAGGKKCGDWWNSSTDKSLLLHLKLNHGIVVQV